MNGTAATDKQIGYLRSLARNNPAATTLITEAGGFNAITKPLASALIGAIKSGGPLPTLPPSYEPVAAAPSFPPTAEQQAAIDLFLTGDSFKIYALAGAGKALRDDQPVRTPEGWRPIGSLAVGDLAMGSDGQPHTVTGVYPQGVVPLVEIEFTAGTKIVASLDHLWACQTKTERDLKKGWSVRTTKEIIELLDNPKTRSMWVPMVSAPIAGHSDPLPLDPWLLGCLIGDGGLTGRSVCFSNPDPGVLARVDTLLPPGVTRVPQAAVSDGKDWRLTSGRFGRANPLARILDELGLRGCGSHEKVIPGQYMLADAPVRLALLQGLMDTDGHADDHNCEWGTTSEKLAEQVEYLIHSLGGLVNVSTRIPTYTYKGEKRNGKRYWRMHVRLPGGVSPFADEAKVDRYRQRSKYQPARRIQAIIPVQEAPATCISVDAPNHLFLTAGCIPTHNTTTIKLMAEAAPTKHVVFSAYNKSIVIDAGSKMPANVDCMTVHAMARRRTPQPFVDRLEKSTGRYLNDKLARIIGVRPFECETPALIAGEPPLPHRFHPVQLTGLVMGALNRFCQTGDAEPSTRHFAYIDGIDVPTPEGERTYTNNRKVRDHLLPSLKAAWADITNENGQLPFDHSHYLKMFSLSGIVLDGVDCLAIDEAQDCSGVMLAIVETQWKAGIQTVLVGDPNQQINEWMGAVDALDRVAIEQSTQLTKSWRFGTAIADLANSILARLDTTMRVIGNDQIDSTVGPSLTPARCYLTRGNATAIEYVLDEIEAGGAPHLVGEGKDVIAFCRAAIDLQTTGETRHRELSCFDSWAAVQQYVTDDEQGQDLKLQVRLIDRFGAQVIIDALTDMPSEADATVVVSTTHKVKGREWETVKLAGDFPSGVDKNGKPVEVDPAEWRLLYVAVTRGKLHSDAQAVGCLFALAV